MLPNVLQCPPIQPVFGHVDCCNEAVFEVLEVFLVQLLLEALVILEELLLLGQTFDSKVLGQVVVPANLEGPPRVTNTAALQPS